MATYLIFSRFSAEFLSRPQGRQTARRRGLRADQSRVPRRPLEGQLGDDRALRNVVDVVESDDPKQTRAAMIIHADGHATTETALATPWKEFLASL